MVPGFDPPTGGILLDVAFPCKLWHVTTAANVATLNGHMGAVYRVAFCPKGETLATGSGDCTIRLGGVPRP